MEKIKLIYNPVSGDGTFKNYLDYIIEKSQKKGFLIEPFRTSKKHSIESALARINEGQYRKILTAGGDGTVNQVINAMLKHNIDLPLGIFPTGTANDYAQCFNLPETIEEVLGILLKDNYTLSDVGVVNDRYFINVASLGQILDAGHKTNSGFKNSLGIFAYYINGISELANLKSTEVKIQSNELNFEGEILLMLVMNGRSAGGFNKLAPYASINDGLLDVLIFKKCAVHELLFLFMALMNGEHVNSQNVIYLRTNEIVVDVDNSKSTDVDGEKGPKFPLKFSVVPSRIKVVSRMNK